MKVSEMAQILNAIKSMRKEELNCVVNAVNEARRRVSVYASTNFTVVNKLSLVDQTEENTLVIS